MNFLFKSTKRECELLGDFGILIQIALGLLSFSSLVGKG